MKKEAYLYNYNIDILQQTHLHINILVNIGVYEFTMQMDCNIFYANEYNHYLEERN